MNKQARHEMVVSYQDEYMAAGRGKRGEILTLLGESTGYDRKYLSRLLRGKYRPHARRKQRGRHYGAALDDVLRVIFEAHDGICPERIHPNLLGMAEHLAAHGEVRLTEGVREQLQRVSLSTLRRIRSRLCQDEPRLLRSRPRPRNDLRRHVPMKRISYQEKQPGHFEVDLVHHCGPSAQGDYLHTLQMVDVATGWSELRAVLGRSFRVMGDGFAAILERLPFELVEIHPDNGPEFFAITCCASLASGRRGLSGHAVAPIRRTTIALWSNATGIWCAATWATNDWTRSPKCTPSTHCMS